MNRVKLLINEMLEGGGGGGGKGKKECLRVMIHHARYFYISFTKTGTAHHKKLLVRKKEEKGIFPFIALLRLS